MSSIGHLELQEGYTSVNLPQTTLFRVPNFNQSSIQSKRQHKKLCLLLPEGYSTVNQSLLESRLQQQLGNKLQLSYYHSVEELERLIYATSQLKVVLIPDVLSEWAKKWAAEHPNIQIQLLIYTQSPAITALAQIVHSEIYPQFKMITNRWAQIEKYMLTITSEGQVIQSPQSNLHIIFDPALSGQLQLQLEQSFTANPTLQRQVKSYTYNQKNDQSLLQVLSTLRLDPYDRILIVVNQTQSPDILVNERLAGNILKQSGPNVGMLLVSPIKYQNNLREHPKTSAVFPTTIEAGMWIQSMLMNTGTSPAQSRQSIKYESNSIIPILQPAPQSPMSQIIPMVMPPQIMQNPQNSTFRPQSPILRRATSPMRKPTSYNQAPSPHIFIQQSNSRWRFFLRKNSAITKRFTYEEYNTLDDLEGRIHNHFTKGGSDKLWILLEDVSELPKYRQRLNNNNIRFILYDPSFSHTTQQKDVVIGSDIREEIEGYLLNYQKRSRNIISPSHLDNSKNILLLFHKALGLDTNELGLWKQKLYGSSVQVGTYVQGARMMKAIATYPKYSTILVVPQSLDNEFGQALANYPLVKKIILLQPSLIRPSYYEHPSVLFVAQSPDEINSFLKTLRYSLRHPPKTISQIFLKPFTNVFIPRDRYDMQYLQFIVMLNPSIRLYPYGNLNELYSLLRYDQNNDALVVGEADLKNKSLKSYQPNVHLIINNEFNHGGSNFIVMSTDDEREILLYIKNLPNNCYNQARALTSPVDVYFDNISASTRPLMNKVEEIMQVNSSLQVYSYDSLSQLEEALNKSISTESTSLIVTDQLAPNRATIQSIIAEKHRQNRDISGVLLKNQQNPMMQSSQLYIFSDSRLENIVDFFDNIPDVSLLRIHSSLMPKPSKVEIPQTQPYFKMDPPKIKTISAAQLTKARDSELITPLIPVPRMPQFGGNVVNNNVSTYPPSVPLNFSNTQPVTIDNPNGFSDYPIVQTPHFAPGSPPSFQNNSMFTSFARSFPMRSSDRTPSFDSSAGRSDTYNSNIKPIQFGGLINESMAPSQDSLQHSFQNSRGYQHNFNVEQRPDQLMGYYSKAQFNETELVQPVNKPQLVYARANVIQPLVIKEIPHYISANIVLNSYENPRVSAQSYSPIERTPQIRHEYFNLNRDIQSIPNYPRVYSLNQFSDNQQKIHRVLSNPLVDSSTDNSIVADNPHGYSEVESNSDNVMTVALLYTNNFEAIRYKDYIERIADRWIVVESFPFRNAQELSNLIQKTNAAFNKTIVMVSHEFRSLFPQCQSLQKSYRKLRSYLLTSPGDVFQLINVFKTGNEQILISNPYKTDTLPLELQRCRRLKVLLPGDYFKDMHRKIVLTDFMKYDSPQDAQNMIARECDPAIYNIIVTTESRLPQTYRFPLLYDNTRIVLLTSRQGISQSKMFSLYGDLFWLYADSNPQAIEFYLMSITNMKKNDGGLVAVSDKPLLFYQRHQLSQLYFFDYLGYFKVQYTNTTDLQRKLNSLLGRLAQGTRVYIINNENGAIRLEELSKTEMEYIGSGMSPDRSSGQTLDAEPPLTTLVGRPHNSWISSSGEFILDADELGISKQRMLIRMFDINLFRDYNDFGYYYLSNSDQASPYADLQYKTIEQLQDIFRRDPKKLMVVFCDRGDERFIPSEMQLSSRVRIMKISQDIEYLDSLHLKCQELEGVINRIKTIENNGRSKYVIFKLKSAQCQVLLQEFMLHSKDFQSIGYRDCEDFDQKISNIKNKFRKLQVICPEIEQPTLKKILEYHSINTVAFMTARSQTDMSELPSQSTLKKEIENLKIFESPRVSVLATKGDTASNVVKHQAKVVSSEIARARSPLRLYEVKSNQSINSFDKDGQAISEVQIRAQPRNQSWLNSVYEKINRSDRVMVIHDNLTEENRSTINRIAQLTNKISYIRPKSTSEFEYFVKSSPQGVFLLVGSNPNIPANHRQAIQLDSADLEKLVKMIQRQQKSNNRSRSLNNGVMGSESNINMDSRQDEDSGDLYFKRMSRTKVTERKPEEKTQQVDEYMLIKSRISAKENRFINILNGQELTILIPSNRLTLKHMIEQETPQVTVLPYTTVANVESHLPKCSKRPTLLLVADDKLISMAGLTQKFPQVRIIASSNVQINHPSVCISLATDKEVLELVKRLRDRNNEVDNRRMEQEMRRISREQQQLFGYSMTLTLRSLSQKIVIMSAVNKNTNIRNMVEKYNSTRVNFIEYDSVDDLELKLKNMANNDSDGLCIIIENDEQIEQIQRLHTMHMRVYFVRSFNNHMKYAKQALLHNDRLIFTGNSSKEIANFINSLVYRSFKKVSKALEGKRRVKKTDSKVSDINLPRQSYSKQDINGSKTSISGNPPLPSTSNISRGKILKHSASSGAVRKASLDNKLKQRQFN